MPPEGLEPAIPAGERPQTYALDRAATGFGKLCIIKKNTGVQLAATQEIRLEINGEKSNDNAS
jgi:hypothetical protein